MPVIDRDFLLKLLELAGPWGVSAMAGAGLAVLALRTWLSEKIKGAINREYDEKLALLQAELKGQYDRELETHKADLKRQSGIEIEELKNRLNMAAAQQIVQFANLHEKRATVIAELYAALKVFESELREYTANFRPVGVRPKAERQQAAVTAANAFVQLFLEKQIFVPHATAVKLNQLCNVYRVALVRFQFNVDLAHKSGLPAAKVWAEIVETIESLSATALVFLGNDFRRLLGDKEAFGDN